MVSLSGPLSRISRVTVDALSRNRKERCKATPADPLQSQRWANVWLKIDGGPCAWRRMRAEARLHLVRVLLACTFLDKDVAILDT